MMHMTFYWGVSATLLFDGWVTKTITQYLMSLLAIFLFGVVHEWLFNLRVVISSKKTGGGGSSPPPRPSHDSETAVPLLEKVPAPKGPTNDLLVTVLYVVNAGTGFLLMLLVMSYNWGVFLAVILGLGVGFAIFRSPIASESFNSSSCCHTA